MWQTNMAPVSLWVHDDLLSLYCIVSYQSSERNLSTNSNQWKSLISIIFFSSFTIRLLKTWKHLSHLYPDINRMIDFTANKTSFVFIIIMAARRALQNSLWYSTVQKIHTPHTHTHTHCCFMALYLGLPRWADTRRGRYQKTSFCILIGVADNRGKCADNPAGRHPIWTIDAPTSIIPTVLRQMPFPPQPSQFILAWDRHQICRIAYLAGGFHTTKQIIIQIQQNIKNNDDLFMHWGLHPNLSKLPVRPCDGAPTSDLQDTRCTERRLLSALCSVLAAQCHQMTQIRRLHCIHSITSLLAVSISYCYCCCYCFFLNLINLFNFMQGCSLTIRIKVTFDLTDWFGHKKQSCHLSKTGAKTANCR